MYKTVVNQVMLIMGLKQTQMMATVFDGVTRPVLRERRRVALALLDAPFESEMTSPA